MFGFRKLSRTSIVTIQKAIDRDDDFRARVAAQATEEAVGRAGHLWLTRPDGWEDDPVWTDDPREVVDPAALSKLRRERDGAEAKAERFREAAEESESARRRAADQLDVARREVHQAEREREDALDQIASLVDERTRAVRLLKGVEADLAATRRDLKVARDATREAEAERMALQDRIAAVEASVASTGEPFEQPAVSGRDASSADQVDMEGLRRAVATASGAVADLGRALSEAAAALDPTGPAEGPHDSSGAATSTMNPGAGSGTRRAPGRRRRTRRRAELPPGMLEGSAEADRHLLGVGDVLLLVDGYNLARDRWNGLSPEEERRRVVQLLEEVQARSGARATAVFDGVTGEVSPMASRSITVRYSPTGTTADEVIADTLRSLPDDVAVIVVSSDREVADHARSQGATVLSSSAFLVATGR